MEERTKKLSKMLYVGYTIFLFLFLGLWLVSTNTQYVPILFIFLGIALPLIGYALTYFLVKMVEAKDPRAHFLIALNIVVMTLTILSLAVSTMVFYSDSVQSDLGAEHNAHVDALVEAGQVDECINYLVSKGLVDTNEAQTTCNLRIAIATHNKEQIMMFFKKKLYKP